MAVVVVGLFSSMIALFILVMIALKLLGWLNISWVWVFAPIWMPFIISTGVMLVIVAIILIKTIIERRRKK